jgi:hypothetical protein
MCNRKALDKSFPTAHVYPINILQHQVLSDCACTSHEYITSSSAFRLHMYIPEIYYSNKCFPTAHVHPWNILQLRSTCAVGKHSMQWYIPEKYICSRKGLDAVIYSWEVHVQCTSHKYIAPSSHFLPHMYLPWIYYSSKWIPTAHVYPRNILLHWVFSYCTCTSH